MRIRPSAGAGSGRPAARPGRGWRLWSRPRVRRAFAAPLTAVLVVTAAAVAVPAPATAGGPTVPLPTVPSTPVTQQTMGSRGPDEATTRALTGNQPAGSTTPDGGGTSAATSLGPSATWNVSPQSGDFTWSYPLRVPPAPGGLAPRLALSYASSAVDGRTSATNNQASWVGDGWDLSPGFIERTYGGCADDADGGTVAPKTGDLCWRSDNATASYHGGGGPLIRDSATGVWRPKADDGSRVERLTGAGNGDNDGEHWKITTVDGTQYFFGSRPDAASTWTVPVFGDDAAEPCHAGSFDASWCVQAYRWNLDRVVDRHGNAMLLHYATETNSYGRNLKDAAVGYVRGGTLRRIEYGLRDGGTAPAFRVEFTTAERCVPGSDCVSSKPANWPDVPWSDACAAATCPGKHSPSFYTTRRLASVTTQVRRDSGWSDVDRWELEHAFPDPGDGEKAALWLRGITHTGLVGGTAAVPQVTFEGARLPNRVYAVDGVGPLNRFRVVAVVSESGGVTSVRYAEPDCAAGNLPANPESNTRRCFPVRWAKTGHAERTDWFHKYVVAQVTTSDRLGSSIEQVVSYEYLDGAAWHHDTSEFTPGARRTWNEYRGFARVRVRTGRADDPAGPVSRVEQRFHRGMHGDKLPAGTRSVTVTDAAGGSRPDHDWLAGFGIEQTTYLGDTDTVVEREVTAPVWRGPTAARGAFAAYAVHPGTQRSFTTLESGGPREQRVDTTYDDRGLPTVVDDQGDVATAADDRCTRTTYVRNTERWLIAFPARTETVGVRCAATPSFPDDAITDTRVAYDGQGFGAAPLRGDVTADERLERRPASGPEYYPHRRASYDVHGRLLTETDALGRVNRTVYTPATGGPVTQVVTTNPAGLAGTTTLEPAWGVPLVAVDANHRRTEIAYDPLGRTTQMWKPNRSRANGQGGNVRFGYLVRRDAPTAITAELLGPNGAYTTSTTLYDGLYRARQTQRPAAGGGRLIVDTRYDSHGRVFRTTEPYVADGAVDTNLWLASDVDTAGATRTEYDGAGRVVASVYLGGGAEKWRTTARYGGDRVHVTPPEGASGVTRILDGRGQLVALRQYRGRAPTGDYDQTSYAYDRAGHLTGITDPAGTRWRYSYDLRGRQTRAVDPDKGAQATEYDVVGRPVRTTDARGVTLAYRYDELNRRTGVYSGSLDGPALAEWTYDTAVGGRGLPASSTRYADGQAYTRRITAYSPLYQPVVSSVTVPVAEAGLAGTYTTVHKYNDDGSPKGVSLPAAGGLPAESINHTYDDASRPLGTTGGLSGGTTVYVSETLYTRYGEAQRIQLGEGTKRAWLSYFYDDHTRRLTRYTVDAEIPRPSLADVHYRYDAVGNIRSMTDSPADGPTDRQCFSYDHRRRLTEAWTPAGDCAAEPDAAALGGPAPYWQSFRFDAVGNRTREVTHGPAGDAVRSYAYPAADQPRPHAVTEVARSGAGGTGTDSYSYDAAGNTVGRDVGGREQALAWSPEGQLASVTEGERRTSYVYDAEGQRLLRRDPTGSTLYLGDQELRRSESTGAVTGTRYYQHGGKLVAVRTTAGVSWLAADHQGTAQLAVDADTLAVRQRRQTPFGGPRGSPGTLPTERGFVGGPVDASTGLVHLGAREYDPAIGRFVSVDPVLDHTDPQQMQGYGYANNSPVTFSDPTGLFFNSILAAVLNALVKALQQAIKKAQTSAWAADKTLRHNAVVKQTQKVIQGQVAARGGDPTKVTVEYTIPGASKNGPMNGKADIVYDDGTNFYIWEVKSDGYTPKQIQDEVDHYVAHLQPQLRNRKVQSGWQLGARWSFVYQSRLGHTEIIEVYDGGKDYPGAVLYSSRKKEEDREKEKPPNVPPAVPAPQTTGNRPPATRTPTPSEPTASPPGRVPCAPGMSSPTCAPMPVPAPRVPEPVGASSSSGISTGDVVAGVAIVAGVGVVAAVGSPVIAVGGGLAALGALVFGS